MAVRTNKKLFEAVDTDMEYLSETGEVEDRVLTAKEQERVLKQVDEEWNVSFPFNEAKRKLNLARLKLYNNQRRESSAVGELLLFTIFNSIHAALYDDQLMVSWEGRSGEGDEDMEENLNALSAYDYDLMGKSQLDYFWNWDAEFFGRGLLLMMDFERAPDYKAPVPEYIDASTFIRDPDACSVNGLGRRMKGAMRYGGWEMGASYWELKDNPAFFNLGFLRKDKTSPNSLLDEMKSAHSEAIGTEWYPARNEMLSKFGNYEFKLVNWLTHIRGKKTMVTLANNRTVVIRMIDLERYGGRWPLIDRTFYPMASNWDGVSIPDLVEDKQRAKAVLINLGLKSAKADVLPSYVYDKNRIKNVNDLNLKFQKFIGVNGRVDNAIMPVQKSTMHQTVDVIMNILDMAAQKATATPELQQGMLSSDKRTLGELELASSKVDTRYSMTAKVYGWSEYEFWKQYYRQYKMHFKDGIDEKVLRIQGALAPIWRTLSRDNIVSDVDPDAKICSRVISEAKNRSELEKAVNVVSFAIQDPRNDIRYISKRMFRLIGWKKEEIDAAFPQTVDELQAEEENLMLNLEKLPPINIMDDHLAHIRIHAKAEMNPNTLAHIRSHKRAMVMKRDRPDLFPSTDMMQQQAGQITPPAMGNKMPVKASPAPSAGASGGKY